MIRRTLNVVVLIAGVLTVSSAGSQAAADDELSPEQVKTAIRKAQRYLKSRQANDGSFQSGLAGHKVGVTSIAMLALLNSGLDENDDAVKKGLQYLRKTPIPGQTYDVSLMLMVFSAVNNGSDHFRMKKLVDLLESGQLKQGNDEGGWNYTCGGGGIGPGRADRSNSQFAVLALRDAAFARLEVKESTWKRVKKYWEDGQEVDGGWSYVRKGGGSIGSMTVAGISSLVIVDRMLKDEKNVDRDGKPICCQEKKPYEKLERGVKWLASNLRTVSVNPGARTNNYYFMYGLERAGRLSGRRFFGKHDWYRAGAKHFVSRQHRTGYWAGQGFGETDPTVGTSMALLFLSKGLAPVLINKLDFGSAKPGQPIAAANDGWNRHQNDARNLTDYVTTLKFWPKLLTWQTVSMQKMLDPDVTKAEQLDALDQAKVLYISCGEVPDELINDSRQHQLLKEYIDRGGFVLLVGNCESSPRLQAGIEKLVENMFRRDDGKVDPSLKLGRLPKDHPIYRAEYDLRDAYEDVPLYGVDYGCRTPLVFAPVHNGYDWACLWDRWKLIPGQKHPEVLSRMLERAMRVGENVLAYATGREPPEKLLQRELENQRGVADKIERGLLQVAKVIHSGDWDIAPRAMRNLLIGLNNAMGSEKRPVGSTKRKVLSAADNNVYRYPVLYMHGRNGFEISKKGREQLKTYLSERGGLLFADACCGSKDFDQSFRELLRSKELFPDKPLERIPVTDELFSDRIGFNLKSVERRTPEAAAEDARLRTATVKAEPFLEGIKIDGRWVVIYSKYDISCALERQASISCSGYIEKDAMRIGINVLAYALLQDVRYFHYVDKRATSPADEAR